MFPSPEMWVHHMTELSDDPENAMSGGDQSSGRYFQVPSAPARCEVRTGLPPERHEFTFTPEERPCPE